MAARAKRGGWGVDNVSNAGLSARTTSTDGSVVVAFRGDLDLASVSAFTAAIEQAIAEAPTGIELDLRQLTFIDSSGVGAYVSAFRRARSNGIRLWIGDRSPQVDRVLELSGVEAALALETDA